MRHIPGLHGWQFHAEATSDAARAGKKLPVITSPAAIPVDVGLQSRKVSVLARRRTWTKCGEFRCDSPDAPQAPPVPAVLGRLASSNHQCAECVRR